MDEGAAVCSVGGSVGCLVAAAVDLLEGKAAVVAETRLLRLVEGLKVFRGEFVVFRSQCLQTSGIMVAVDNIDCALGDRDGVAGGVGGLVDMDVGVAVGGAAVVVGAEDGTLDVGGAYGRGGVGRVGRVGRVDRRVERAGGPADIDMGDTLVGAYLVARRGEGAATVDRAEHMAAEHVDVGVAIDAAGEGRGFGAEGVVAGEAETFAEVSARDGGVVGGIDRPGDIVLILVGVGVGIVVGFVAAVAAAVDVAVNIGLTVVGNLGADLSVVDGDVGVADNLSLLGAAEDGTHDDGHRVGGGTEVGGVAYGDGGRPGLAEGDPMWVLDVHVALAAAEDVAGAGVYEMAFVVLDGPVAGFGAIDVVICELLGGADGGGTVDIHRGGACLGHVGAGSFVSPADAGHLAAAEDRTPDCRFALDEDIGVHHLAEEDVGRVDTVALAGTEDVAYGVVAGKQGVFIGGADLRATGDMDERHAMVDGVVVAVVADEAGDAAERVDAGESHTATAEDGAHDDAAIHIDVDIAGHAAIGKVGVQEVAASAEDVAVVGGGAVGTHDAALVGGAHVA